ncbi:hypothetical protein DL762_001808 [Monosporascus cannonballus]|uniref:Nephrocystin 3-like N-terminal domain-containing protein n=1 Tax=Monosporascus cannonballus TaxID=155416 RepID=A0ABY0HJU0_9PEZI|nr:hypothetical protein DL762_001808 [Monosporascus cannonballus]
MDDSQTSTFRDQYTVGWIAALAIEQAAATAILDEEHEKPCDFTQPPTDSVYGTAAAATTATLMISSFPQVRIGLMVGIGAGIPRPSDDIDIRLGDVVVSKPSGQHGGVVASGSSQGCGPAPGEAQQEIPREERETLDPEIHYGHIASSNTLFKDSMARDTILEELGDECLCFEMEAAGLMNDFPCLVIRGICDYGDSHKNDRWQRYAAATAAAYAKELVGVIPGQELEKAWRAADLMESIAHTVEETKTIAMNINDGLGQIASRKRQNDMRRWLSPPDPSTNYNRARKLRHENSGQWFLQSPAYSSWKRERNSFLWLNGKPGCGKTVLSSTILEDLQTSVSRIPTLLYFYFDFNDTMKQSLESMVRTLIYQLYFKSPDELDTLYSSCESGKSQPSIDSRCNTLQHMMQQAGEVWIVLDALDECPTRQQRPDGGLLGSRANMTLRQMCIS